MVKKRAKNGIFAYHYAKTPQKEGEKVIFFRGECRDEWGCHFFFCLFNI